LRARSLGVALVAAALVAACLLLAAGWRSERVDYDQHRPDDTAPPAITFAGVAGQSVGQSFRPHLPVTAITLRIGNARATADGKLRFVLREGGVAGRTISDLPIQPSSATRLYFPLGPLTAERDYYFALEGDRATLSSLAISYYPADSYSGGAMYVDGKQQSGDLTVRWLARYDGLAALGDTVAGLLGNLWLAVCVLLLYLLPGRAALALLPTGVLNAAQKLVAAPALTLAMLPVLLLWLQPTGLRLGGWQAWLLLAICAAVVGGDEWRRRGVEGLRQVQGWGRYALLGGYLLVGGAMRLLTAAPMQAGSGIDGYHHSLITQMIGERGVLPTDYQPYAPLASFTYHYGFHTLAAALGWLTGLGSVPLTLLTGQLLSVLVAASLYLVVEKLVGNSLMALAAAFTVSILTIFPTFYVNWSRFTQLAGLELLPVALLLLVLAATPDQATPQRGGWLAGRWRLTALAVLAGGGLFVVHYRIWIVYATFAAILSAANLLAPLAAGRSLRAASYRLLATSLPVALGLLLVLPWAINLLRNFSVQVVNKTDGSNAAFYDLITLIGDQPLRYFSTWPLLGLAVGGGLLSLLRRERWAIVLLLWCELHILLSNPYWVRLPFAGLVDNVTLVQCSFIPVAIFAAYAVAALLSWVGSMVAGQLDASGRRTLAAGCAAVTLAAGVAGGLPQLDILDLKPYVASQDVAAMRWIAANTPQDARFLVSDFAFTWASNLAQGSDAGLWLPLLSRPTGSEPPTTVRTSTAPPQPSYNERLADPAYLTMTVETTLAAVALTNAATTDERSVIAAWQTLREYGVGYIYVGSRGGILSPLTLDRYPQAVPLYHADGVWVYAIR